MSATPVVLGPWVCHPFLLGAHKEVEKVVIYVRLTAAETALVALVCRCI